MNYKQLTKLNNIPKTNDKTIFIYLKIKISHSKKIKYNSKSSKADNIISLKFKAKSNFIKLKFKPQQKYNNNSTWYINTKKNSKGEGNSMILKRNKLLYISLYKRIYNNRDDIAVFNCNNKRTS